MAMLINEGVILNGWLQVTDSTDANDVPIEWKQKYCVLNQNGRKLILHEEDEEGEIFQTPSGSEDESDKRHPRFHKSRSAGSFLDSRRSSAPNVQVKAEAVDGSGSNALKQFLSKKLPIPYLRRTRSTSKIGSKDKEDLGETPRLVSWRSHESLLCVSDKVESIDLPLRGLTVVRPVHSTVLHRSHCFQITTPLETRYFTCNSAEDAHNWVSGLKGIVYPNRDKEKRVDTSLDVWLFEAKGLPSKKRYYCEIVLDKVLYGRTSTKLKSDILFWGEQFSFDDLPSVEKLCLYVFRENDSKKKRKERSVFVGSVEVPLDSIQANSEVEKWLHLRLPGASPRPSPKSATNSKNDQLSIRVKVRYQTVEIQPIANYKDLHEYIKQNYFLLCKELEPSITLKAKDELAQTLLRILQVTNQAKEFLADIIIAEVNSLENENLTFRGNTLATKSMDTYMKMVGHKYLQKTFSQFVKGLYDLEDDFEVDPTKLTSGNLIDNQKNLLRLVEEAWAHVLGSFYLFPTDLQETFCLIKKRCEIVEKDVSAKLISGSVFLRFLCPAILSPSLFRLTREYPDEKTARCLTLIAKALQNLANFTRFGGKEEYMEGLNEFVERELPNMKNFLDLISSKPENSERSSFDGYIDIGRELSVIAKLLAEQLPQLSEESQAKLDPLKHILDELNANAGANNLGKMPRAKDFEIDSLTPMTRSYSLPKDAEHKSFRSRSVMSKILPKNRASLFKDSSLSSAQDYVSGCSLIAHTPLKPKGSSQRTKGRAADQKSRIWNALKPSKGHDSSLTVDQSQFMRSSSFHGRSSRDERAYHLTSSRSFDTANRHSREQANIPKPELRLDQSSFENGSDKDTLDRQRSHSDEMSARSRSNSLVTRTQSKSASRLPQQTIEGDKTIRRLPDIIHESVTWNDITEQPDQPLYFSPATEPMTPLGNRQFKFGIDYTGHGEEDNLNNSADSMKLKQAKILDIARLNGNVNAVNGQVKETEQSAVPISYNTWSSKSSGSTASLNRSDNYNSSTQDLNSADSGLPQIHAHSLASVATSTATCSNTDLNANCSHDDSLNNGHQYKPHSDSILSGYSSVCSDHERGSVCSLETCSCTSSEDPESNDHHNHHYQDHHRRRHAPNRNGSFYDDRQNYEAYNHSHESQLGEARMEGAEKVADASPQAIGMPKSSEEYEKEIADLRRQLHESKLQLRQKDEEFAKRASSYEHSIAASKMKTAEAEMKFRKLKKEKDDKMKSITSRLMIFETELRKENSETQEIVQAKQRIIEVQEKRIKSLDSANKRLVAALNQLRSKHTSRNGTVGQSKTTHSAESRTTSHRKDDNDNNNDSEEV